MKYPNGNKVTRVYLFMPGLWLTHQTAVRIEILDSYVIVLYLNFSTLKLSFNNIRQHTHHAKWYRNHSNVHRIAFCYQLYQLKHLFADVPTISTTFSLFSVGNGAFNFVRSYWFDSDFDLWVEQKSYKLCLCKQNDMRQLKCVQIFFFFLAKFNWLGKRSWFIWFHCALKTLSQI